MTSITKQLHEAFERKIKEKKHGKVKRTLAEFQIEQGVTRKKATEIFNAYVHIGKIRIHETLENFYDPDWELIEEKPQNDLKKAREELRRKK